MDAILSFLNEMRRSDWYNEVSFQERKYNDIKVQQTELSYSYKIAPLYNAAVLSLINVPKEKYEIIQKLIEEVVECQENFEVPSEELLETLMQDYKQSDCKICGLKEDYDYLWFVRNCMMTQKYYLEKFRNKFPQQKNKIEIEETDCFKTESHTEQEPIKGVKGLASYLNIGTTKAQEILNSKILQKHGIAYRVGKAWNIKPHKLDEFLSNNPNILYKRNK